MPAIIKKTQNILSLLKYTAACAVLPVVLLTAGFAGAAGTDLVQQGGDVRPAGDGAAANDGRLHGPEYDHYVPTPIGDRSEAWGEGAYGPGHLRRMSPTEALPAEPQPARVVDVP